MAILRLQLQIEIDTTSREAHVITQKMVEGLPAVCSNPGCGKPVDLKRKYCGRTCFTAHGRREQKAPRKKRQAPLQLGAPIPLAAQQRIDNTFAYFTFPGGVA